MNSMAHSIPLPNEPRQTNMGAEGLAVTGMATPGGILHDTPGDISGVDDSLDDQLGNIDNVFNDAGVARQHSLPEDDAEDLFDDSHLPKSGKSLGAPSETSGLRVESLMSNGTPIAAAAILEVNDNNDGEIFLPNTDLEPVDSGTSELYN